MGLAGSRRGGAPARRILALLLVLACTWCVVSCGNEPADPGAQMQAELDELRVALAAGDAARVCARVAEAACPKVARYLIEHGRPDVTPLRSGRRTVIDVDRVRDRAVATVTLNERIPGRLGFLQRDGEWRLTGLAVRPDEGRSRWRWATNSQVESFRAGRMRAGERAPCPPVTAIVHAGHSAVRGGCRFRVASRRTRVVMLTALGDYEVARCASSHLLHIASNTTAILADRIRFGGHGLCKRIRRCRDGETGLRYPWQGSKLRGRFAPPLHMQLDICVNTPLGRARGMFHFELTRDGDRWTAMPSDYPIGASSIQFGGASTFKPGGLMLRPSGF